MKKTVSVVAAAMFLVASSYANEPIKVATVAGSQGKKTVAKQPEKSQPSDYALESFGCCGLPH